MTQKLTVLQALKDAGDRGVSNGELNALGIFRYSARVHELREEGHQIRTVNGKNGLAKFFYEGGPVRLEAARFETAPAQTVAEETATLFELPTQHSGHYDTAA